MRKSELYPVCVLIGKRDCGKTTFMKGDPNIPVESKVQLHVQLAKLKGAIIIDTMRERENYTEVKKITHPRQYKSGVVHLITSAENIEEQVVYITKYVRDTFIVFEDAVKLVPMAIRKTPFEYLVVDSKNIHCPVFFMYHSFKAVPPAMFMYLDEIQLFKCYGTPKDRKEELLNYEEVVVAHETIMSSKNPFVNINIKSGA